ncbi:MAG: PIG-L family deacetylase, partial [Jatrophihabitantaceae bacterium]
GLLVDQLTGLLRPSDLVISPWRYDGHPDHESTAVAAGQAAGTCGARHLQAPIWGWHWADPDTDQLPATGVTLIQLDGPAHTAKRQAIDCFASQLQPDPSTGAAAILPDWAIRRLSRPVEVLLA